jgi:hypothetical protein
MEGKIKSTRDGNRTRTGISAHRILSPACLPIPPPEHFNQLLSKIPLHCAERYF